MLNGGTYIDEAMKTDFRFSDITILEADGEYQNAIELMKKEPHPWCLISDLTLIHQFGMCAMRLEFYETGDLKITGFVPSITDPSANFDLRLLLAWTAANGWNKPQPSRYVIAEMKEFWKHMWQVYLVDSPILDDRHGERPSLDFAPLPEEPDGQQPEPPAGQ